MQHSITWTAPLISYLTTLSLVCAFALIALRTLQLCIKVYALQSIFLALTAMAMGIESSQYHLVGIALLVLAVKGWAIPWFLLRVMEKVGIKRESADYVTAPISMLVGIGLALLSYAVIGRLTSMDAAALRGFALAITFMLIGLWLMAARTKALLQVIGLLTVENGLFLAALATTFGMPMIVELGISFDLLVTVIVTGLLIFRIQNTFSSIHTEHLSRLKG